MKMKLLVMLTVVFGGMAWMILSNPTPVWAGPPDGRMDIIAGNLYDTDQVCINNGSTEFRCSGVANSAGGSQELATGKFNDDDYLDVVVADRDKNRVCLNDGNGKLSCKEIGTSAYTANVAVGDVDGDRDLDLIFANIPLHGRDGRNHLCLNDGNGNFTCSNLSDHKNSSTDVAMGDIDGDRDLDVIFTHALYNLATPLGVPDEQLCLNDGSGTFDCSYIPNTKEYSYAIALGDLDGDRDIDAVINRRGADQLCVNNGTGQFTCSNINGTNGAGQIALGRINADPHLDIVLARSGQPNRVCINGANLSYGCTDIDNVKRQTTDLALGDLNGDAYLDVVFAINGAPSMRQCLNDGSGAFTCSVIVAGQRKNTWGIGIGDFGSNIPPTADAGGPYHVDEGGTVTLDASGSSDPDQATNTLTYKWDFDGDGQYDDATGIKPSFSANGMFDPQTVTIGLRVRDNTNLERTTTTQLTIHNVAPTVSGGADQNVFRNQVVNLAGTWTDPAGAADEIYNWSWDLDGDGNADDSGNGSYGETISRTTSFAEAGVMNLRFTVTDKDGGKESDTVQITVVNRPPIVVDDHYETNEDQPLHLPAPGVLDNDNDDDGDPMTAILVSGPNNGTVTFNADGSFHYIPAVGFFGSDSFTYKANDGRDDSTTATVTIEVGELLLPTTGFQLYLSPSRTIRLDGLRIADEDIAWYDFFAQSWTMLFDGSDVGLKKSDIDALHLGANDTILLSFDRPINFPTLGWIDDSDIVKFIPTLLGEETAGTWELYFDGSDVDLATNGEDIDGIGFSPEGDLLITTMGTANVAGIRAADEDILRFKGTSWGENTAGTWDLYFDGSDVRLSAGSEDLNGISVNHKDGIIYLTTKGNFQVTSGNLLNGDADDIMGCIDPIIGDATSCNFATLFDGDTKQWRKDIDGITVTSLRMATYTTAAHNRENDGEVMPYEVAADDFVIDGDDPELDQFDLEETKLFLPLVTR